MMKMCFADFCFDGLIFKFVYFKGILENGLFVKDSHVLAKTYVKTPSFYLIDILGVLPLELVVNAIVPSIHFLPIIRLNRLLKLTRLLEFRLKTETLTNFPNAFRIISLFLTIILIIHWNACAYYLFSKYLGIGSDDWVFNNNTESRNQFLGQYTRCFYWSTLTLTTISNVAPPTVSLQKLYITVNYLLGILIFATIVGNVTEIISSSGARKTEFQQKIDSVKNYMQLRKVNEPIQQRVIKWFNYSWTNSQGLDENIVLKDTLQENLQAEISINVHLETLRRVHIFQDCEPGLLQELVTKLRLQVFSPLDYVCRKGDIGREMYIIKHGKLCVVSDDGKTIYAQLGEGSYFGEISILDIAGSKTGNRRTANVISVGYSDLFCLTKADLWQALVEYPMAKKTLMEKGKSLLRKDNLLDEDIAEESDKREEFNNVVNDRLLKLKLSFDALETRLARTIGEYKVNMMKLRSRIDNVKKQIES